MKIDYLTNIYQIEDHFLMNFLLNIKIRLYDFTNEKNTNINVNNITYTFIWMFRG